MTEEESSGVRARDGEKDINGWFVLSLLGGYLIFWLREELVVI